MMMAVMMAAALAAQDTCAPPSSAWLSLLPEGQEKREFILDCTGCHLFNEVTALAGGAPRGYAGWRDAVTRMLGFAGATTSFPVIGANRDADHTAAWLARNLGERRAASVRCGRPLPAGATVTEYLLPEPRDLAHDVALDSAGRVLVTGMFTHTIYVLEPGAAQFTSEAIPLPRANPRAIEVDRAGDWWVVLGGPNRLARRRTSGTWTFYDAGLYAHSVALDGRGRAWFNGHFTRDPELVGYVDAAADSVRRLPVVAHPTMARQDGGPIPYEIRAAPDGAIWMSELAGNRIVRIGPDGTSRAWDMPVPASGPRRLDVDANGVVWIPTYAGNELVRFDPRTQRFERIALPVRDALPYVVRVDPSNGIVWIGTAAADAVFSYDPRRHAFRSYPLPSRGAMIRHMAVNPRTHEVWLAYGASPGIPARIARLVPG